MIFPGVKNDIRCLKGGARWLSVGHSLSWGSLHIIQITRPHHHHSPPRTQVVKISFQVLVLISNICFNLMSFIVECLNSPGTMCMPQTFSELLCQNSNYSPELCPKSSAAVKIPENYLIMLTFPEFYAPTLLQTNFCVYNVAGYWAPRAEQDLPTQLFCCFPANTQT